MRSTDHRHAPRRFGARSSQRIAVVAAAVVAATGLAVAVAGIVSIAPSSAAAPPIRADEPAISPFSIERRGADVPFTEIEAETADTNGTVIGPDRTYTTLPSEASGRQAVRLEGAGQYVEFTLPEPVNAMSVRYSVPDNAEGTGITSPVDLVVDGDQARELPFTSKYGWYYGSYPFTNTPGDNPHHFYDETRTMFGSTLPAGTKVRIEVSSATTVPWVIVDLADFEAVPDPIARPADSLSVDEFGADGTGEQDSTAAFQAAVDAGGQQNKAVWIPEGTYRLTDHVIVDNVTLRGAGPWYSVLTGRHPTDLTKTVGVYGKYVEDGGPSQNVTLQDFAIMGEITERVDEDQVNAIGGAMSDSVVDNVWMQHTKVGAWMDGPMDNFTIRNSRILDQTADAVNFHRGVTNSTVHNTFVRNTGDDGLAMWAEEQNNVGNSFTSNTVVLPILANHIAIYGGKDITVTDNVLADSITNGGALHVGNRYPGVDPGNGTDVSGTFTLARNTAIRAGNTDYGWPFPIGAIWFDSRNSPIDKATINVTDTEILDSSYAAIHFVSGTTNGVNFENVDIDGTGTFALQLNDPGAASFTNVEATNIGFTENAVYSCLGEGFEITLAGGNSGWNEQLPETYCGEWPDPR